jgi:hypothetical protein
MAYLRWRVDAIYENMRMIQNKCHPMHDVLVAEFCFLQIRYCCEILALGCVAIHLDASLARSLEKERDAKAIMKPFDKTKPNFFPLPVKVAHTDATATHNDDHVEGALTKQELLETYSRLGDALHIGHLKKYKAARLPAYDLKQVDDFMRKLTRLLDRHTYTFEDGAHMIMVIMNEDPTGKIWLHYLDRGDPPAPPPDTKSR